MFAAILFSRQGEGFAELRFGLRQLPLFPEDASEVVEKIGCICIFAARSFLLQLIVGSESLPEHRFCLGQLVPGCEYQSEQIKRLSHLLLTIIGQPSNYRQ